MVSKSAIMDSLLVFPNSSFLVKGHMDTHHLEAKPAGGVINLFPDLEEEVIFRLGKEISHKSDSFSEERSFEGLAIYENTSYHGHITVRKYKEGETVVFKPEKPNPWLLPILYMASKLPEAPMCMAINMRKNRKNARVVVPYSWMKEEYEKVMSEMGEKSIFVNLDKRLALEEAFRYSGKRIYNDPQELIDGIIIGLEITLPGGALMFINNPHVSIPIMLVAAAAKAAESYSGYRQKKLLEAMGGNKNNRYGSVISSFPYGVVNKYTLTKWLGTEPKKYRISEKYGLTLVSLNK